MLMKKNCAYYLLLVLFALNENYYGSVADASVERWKETLFYEKASWTNNCPSLSLEIANARPVLRGLFRVDLIKLRSQSSIGLKTNTVDSNKSL